MSNENNESSPLATCPFCARTFKGKRGLGAHRRACAVAKAAGKGILADMSIVNALVAGLEWLRGEVASNARVECLNRYESTKAVATPATDGSLAYCVSCGTIGHKPSMVWQVVPSKCSSGYLARAYSCFDCLAMATGLCLGLEVWKSNTVARKVAAMEAIAGPAKDAGHARRRERLAQYVVDKSAAGMPPRKVEAPPVPTTIRNALRAAAQKFLGRFL